jgi:hypothetical protein
MFAVQKSETQVASDVNSLLLQIKSNLNKGGTVLFIPNSISWLANHLDWKENSVYVYANRYVNSFRSVSRSALPWVRVRQPEWQKFRVFALRLHRFLFHCVVAELLGVPMLVHITR